MATISVDDGSDSDPEETTSWQAQVHMPALAQPAPVPQLAPSSTGQLSQRVKFVPPPRPDLILRAENGDEFPVRKAYLELSSMVFRDMLAFDEGADASGRSRKRKRGSTAGAQEVKLEEGKEELDSDDDGDATPSEEATRSSSPATSSQGGNLPVVDISDSAEDINFFLIAVHNQLSLNETLAIEDVELLLRMADKYASQSVTLLAFFHLQPLVPRQFNRALALGTLYKHFNTVRLAIKYQRSSTVKMKGIPQDLFVQLSSSQLYALLQVEASAGAANYRSPDWPKLAKDLGIDLP